MFFCIDCQDHSTSEEIESQDGLCHCDSDNVVAVSWDHFVGYDWIEDNSDAGFAHPPIKYCQCEDYPCCGHN